jgi:hypothetical protein
MQELLTKETTLVFGCERNPCPKDGLPPGREPWSSIPPMLAPGGAALLVIGGAVPRGSEECGDTTGTDVDTGATGACVIGSNGA